MTLISGTKEFTLPKPNMEYITTDEAARKALSAIDRHDVIAIDTETTALDPYEAKWSLLQIGTGNKSYVFDMRNDTQYSSIDRKIFNPLFTDSSKLKLLQNAAYDMKIIKVNNDIYLNNVYDTMLAEQLLYLGLGFTKASLAALVSKYLGLDLPKEPRSTFGTYGQKFEDFQLEYAANDVTVLHMIRDIQLDNILKEGLSNVFDLECRFLVPLCEMELNGITIDVDKWRKIMKEAEEERDETKIKIQQSLDGINPQTTLFGVSLTNIDSNGQLKKALLHLGLELENTDVKALSKYKGLPVIDALLDYRKSNKLISTYAEPLLEKINPYTGRLHTSFKQMVSTGRMSSANPNLQNIPRKQKYRSCFIAKDGYSLVTADMSGAELRILGNLSKDPIFIEAYATGQDLHTRTSAEVFGVSYDKVTKDMRNAAKAINFGLCASEDTVIFSNSGMKAIKDITIGEVVAHDIGSDNVIDAAFMGEKEVFEVTTKYGYTMEVTEDHLVKVISSDGIYRDKKLSDLDPLNDLICIKKGTNMFSSEDVMLPNVQVDSRTNHRPFETPQVLTTDWSAFIGLFVSEGSVFKTKGRDNYSTVSFGFSKDNPEFIEKVDVLLTTLFGNRVSRPKDEYARFVINSVDFSEWLVTLCDIRDMDKTNTISVPYCIKVSDRQNQISFLKYLFEGDGSVKKVGKSSKVTYSSNSYSLLRDVQLMLLNFGILSSITEEKRNGIGAYYILSIVSCESRDKFANEIGFVSSNKNDKIIDNSLYNVSTYFIGKHHDRIAYIMRNYNVSKQLKDRFYKSRFSDDVGNIYIKELSKYDDFFSFIYTNNIVPLDILSIKSKGIKKVYDLSINNHQYFIANGFVVHNCYGMSPVGLSARLGINKKEAEDMINRYFNRYRGIKKYLDKAAKDAVANRHSVTIAGRKRYYAMPPFDHPDRKKIQSGIERQGMNAGIQGANADTIKESMIILVERLKDYDAKLVLTVHDEVIVEVRDDQRHEVAEVVAGSLVSGFGKYFNTIPMETEALIGKSWLKGLCEDKSTGKPCGCNEMKFVEGGKYGTKLVCSKCGAAQD